MTSLIVFDLSEVLIRGLIGIEAYYAEVLGIPPEDALLLFGGENLHQYCRGAIDESQYLAAVTRAHAGIVAENARHVIRKNFAVMMPGVRELTETLRRAHRLVLVSDHGRDWVEHILAIHPWLQSGRSVSSPSSTAA
jgi:phosphoserine phosphatase